MDSILDLSSVRERVSRISVKSYQLLPEFNERGRRTELLRGYVIEKVRKTPLHCTIAARLHKFLTELIPADFIWRQDDPLTFHDSEPEPDLAIVRGTRDDFFDAHPRTAALAVEVSVTTVQEDREKAALYAEAGVEEYWIIVPPEKTVEVYRQPEAGRYREIRLYGVGETLECSAVVGLRVTLGELFED